MSHWTDIAIKCLRDEAAALLDRFPDSDARRALLALIDFIIVREH